MTHSLGGQTLALAAVVQAAELVHRTARGESVSQPDIELLLGSLFITDPRDMSEIYGKPANLNSGIVTALALLRKPTSNQLPVMKYALALLEVETSLRKSPRLVAALAEGIKRLDAERSELSENEMFDHFARLYKATISQLQPRIKVLGRPETLSRQEVADQIRTLLLAGVRAAWLWHQLGGRRWKLLFYRRALRQALISYSTPPENH